VKFTEALRLVRDSPEGRALPVRLAMSGTPDVLLLYLQAAAAERGYVIEPDFLPFNTLRQFLLTEERDGSPVRYILLPWDLVPELDWRSGIPAGAPEAQAMDAAASQFLEALGEDAHASFYIPAPVPPLHHHPAPVRRLSRTLAESLRWRGAEIWPADWFSLSAYLGSGTALASARLGEAAREIVASLTAQRAEPRKVLVTDLDGVLWGGVVGEDGPEGIECAPEGKGYRHFLFQTFLRKLRREGVLLAAISRNDPELAEAGLGHENLLVHEEDFVAVLASYNAKSAQLRQLSESLNLGLESFVFVDDNPVELAEVREALPGITCAEFPRSEDAMPGFFDHLADLFARERVTVEDRERTDLYRRRLEGLPPSEAEGADLSRFLETLEMRLVVRDRTEARRERAVQLINKTNQFNLNGIRRLDAEVAGLLAEGGRLYTASLADRTGSHGEILACLMDGEGRIRSFVMSCRVFQRRVEHGFLGWLLDRQGGALGPFEFRATPRNEPIRRFLASLGLEPPETAGDVHVPSESIRRLAGSAAPLFELVEEG
jgi:FkbH-like protein